MYLELNSLYVFENQNPVDTNIENEIKKLNNTGMSGCYTSFSNNIYIKISIERNIKGQYSITCHKYNRTTREYNDLIFDGECQIEPQLDNTNKILVTRLTSTDRNTDIFYFKGQKDGEFIKSIYCKNNPPMLSKYVIEQSNATCRDEFKRLCNQQYYDERNCVLIIKVNGIGKPQIVKNENGIEFINNILKQQIQKSDGFDYGLHNQLNYSRTVLKCQYINSIRLFQELGNKYFSQLTDLDDFLSGFGLQLLQQNDLSKPNFAIIPVCANGHISTLLLDLRRDNILEPISERLYSFDSSLYHYDQNIFGGLITKDHKLSAQSLQLTGCCGYWTSCFIEECSKITDIEEIKKQFKTGEMQLKVACKVSEIIDVKDTKLIYELKDPLYNEGDDNLKSFIEDNILVKIKDTNKYFLLDRENIYKSTCVDLTAIITQQENSQLIISDNNLAKLKEQVIKQNQELFNMKQKRIEEFKEQIEFIKDILETEPDKGERDKLFCDNLAKLEYLKNRIKLNSDRQWEYLSIQEKFGHNNRESSKLYHNNMEICESYNALYNKELQQLSPDLKEYFEQQQHYYNQLLAIEQRNIKNTQNDYHRIPNTNQLQLNKIKSFRNRKIIG